MSTPLPETYSIPEKITVSCDSYLHLVCPLSPCVTCHCIVCFVYTPVWFCPVSTQCVCLFLHSDLGFQKERLTALGQVSTRRPCCGLVNSHPLPCGCQGDSHRLPLPALIQAVWEAALFLLLLIARLSLHWDFCGSPAQDSLTAHFFTSTAVVFTATHVPSILGPVTSVNLQGLPTTCYVKSSLPGLVIQVSGLSQTFKSYLPLCSQGCLCPGIRLLSSCPIPFTSDSAVCPSFPATCSCLLHCSQFYSLFQAQFKSHLFLDGSLGLPNLFSGQREFMV